MIALTRWHRGFLMTSSSMVALYCIFWIVDVLFLEGDYDPLGLAVLPLAACLYCALAFWLIVFPSAHLIKFAVNKFGMNDRLLWGSLGCAFLCATPGVFLGLLPGGTASGVVLWAAFGSISGFLFFMLSATTKMSEQTDAANSRPSGTSGTSDAEASAPPEASGNS